MDTLNYNNMTYFIKKSYRKNILSTVALLLSILFAVVLLSGSAAAFSDYEEQTAATLYEDLDEKYEIREFTEDEEAYIILQRLQKNIVDKEFKDENFKVHHIMDKNINAYYIGAGNIMIFEGLLSELESSGQLAGLIAHEIGHGVRKHLSEDMRRNLGLTILNILFNEFTDNQYQTMTNVFQTLVSRGYSREQEREADIYAVDLMMRAGYDPQGLVDLMKLFKEKSANIKLLEFTQTHPVPESRIEYINEYIAQKKSVNSGNSEKTQNQTADKNDAEYENTSQAEMKLEEKIELEKELNDDIIKLNYPAEWQFEKLKSSEPRDIFKYQFESKKRSGQILLKDLSEKKFMETARKYFQYAAIKSEEAGNEIEKSTRSVNGLNIYQLNWEENNQLNYEYYLEKESTNKMLKLTFKSDRDSKAESEKIFESIVASITFE